MGVQSIRVAKLINEVEEGRLEVTPFFQRRQVWTNMDKEFFILHFPRTVSLMRPGA
jgi:hypothetical protein